MHDTERQEALNKEAARISKTIALFQHRIAVLSGKGGVGKTSVSVNLAYGFQMAGFNAGILDADVTGPNVPKMLGIDDQPIMLNDLMIPFEKEGVKMISMAGLLKKGQPLIWRGPMRSKIIHQFLADVEWGPLDYMIADLPPGTGDEVLSIGQQMKPDLAIIVTTPQEVAVMDAERAVRMAQELSIPAIGVVENMAGLICPLCGKNIHLFGKGGGQRLADELGIHFLGSIPFDMDVRALADEGRPFMMEKQNTAVAKAYRSIVAAIRAEFEARRDPDPT